MNTERGFKAAKDASKNADYDEYKLSRKLGAAIFYKGELISLGWNSKKTHPLQYKYNSERYQDDSCLPKIHAEIMAISKMQHLDIDFSKVDLFVYRENTDGLALSKPCRSCEKCIRELGIKKVHYTGYGSYVYEKYE